MELDLQSLYLAPSAQLSHWLRPRNPLHFPRIWAHIRGRVGQPRLTTSLSDPLD
jgi:hypothetical protein